MKKTDKKMSNGFTMIEIMVVVVIVAILAAIAVPTYVKYVESARASEAKSVIGNIDNAGKMYYQTYGVWPTDVEELEQAGQLEVDRSTKRKWAFELQMANQGGKIIATSTGDMDGGEGKVVEFDREAGRYRGYGTTEKN